MRGLSIILTLKGFVTLSKVINFDKNETESKMENLTHSFTETKLVLQLIEKSQIKSKTVVSWSLRKKKARIFCTVYFVRRKFFLTFVFYLNVSNLQTFTYQKTLVHKLLLLVFKVIESLPSVLNLYLSNCNILPF